MNISLALHLLLGFSAQAEQNAQTSTTSVAQSSASEVLVLYEKTFVHESPSELSAIVRMVYVGEVLRVEEKLNTESGAWFRVKIGHRRTGFVSASQVGNAADVEERVWQPERIIRNERPLGVGILGYGGVFGAGLQLRYQATTRVGVVLSTGAVVDKREVKGTMFGSGLQMHVALWNISPFIEAGIGRVSYHDKTSTQRVLYVYGKGGIEWMLDQGWYFSLFLTFMRSADIEIVYEYEDAADGASGVGDYGFLNVGDQNALQFLRPGATIGYAF